MNLFWLSFSSSSPSVFFFFFSIFFVILSSLGALTFSIRGSGLSMKSTLTATFFSSRLLGKRSFSTLENMDFLFGAVVSRCPKCQNNPSIDDQVIITLEKTIQSSTNSAVVDTSVFSISRQPVFVLGSLAPSSPSFAV